MATTSETNTPDENDRELEQEREETEVADGPRAVAFETATEALTDVFEIDGRAGETITDLQTTKTDEGHQLVATVEKSRSTLLSHRLNSAKRTGRRVGGTATVLAALATLAYVVLTARRLLGGGDDAYEDETGEDETTH